MYLEIVILNIVRAFSWQMVLMGLPFFLLVCTRASSSDNNLTFESYRIGYALKCGFMFYFCGDLGFFGAN